MTLPHQFTTLRTDDRRTVLFCGAGLSYGMVENPAELAVKCEKATSQLGCSYAEELTTENRYTYLYPWAQEIEDQLIRNGKNTPKLDIAQELGILDDRKWLGEGIDALSLRGNTPKHTGRTLWLP